MHTHIVHIRYGFIPRCEWNLPIIFLRIEAKEDSTIDAYWFWWLLNEFHSITKCWLLYILTELHTQMHIFLALPCIIPIHWFYCSKSISKWLCMYGWVVSCEMVGNCVSVLCEMKGFYMIESPVVSFMRLLFEWNCMRFGLTRCDYSHISFSSDGILYIDMFFALIILKPTRSIGGMLLAAVMRLTNVCYGEDLNSSGCHTIFDVTKIEFAPWSHN